jgi:hypothetical protein
MSYRRSVDMVAKRVLIAEVVVITARGLGVLIKELPGMVREVRIWRMVGLRAGSRHPR